jgi:predicted MFS family arabinose efflux permease
MGKVGLFIGGVFGIGMLAGQVAGTVVATRLGRRGIFVPLQLCIWANLSLVPLYLGAFWVGDVRLSMAFTAAAAFMCTFPHSAQTSGYQTSLPPDVRSTGHAVLALMVSVVGMGIAPLIIGMLSDSFAAAGSPQPLRPALSFALVLFVIAGLAGWKAYRLGLGRERGATV